VTPYEAAEDEEQRAEVLHLLQVLDTPPEERFDRIARVAAALFQVPIAFVALMDRDRLWLKSCIGGLPQDIPRGDTFCSRTVLTERPLVVPDLTRDERFRDFDLVTGEAGFRFYAGHPLVVQGRVVGTLCLLDRRPRSFDAEAVARLEDLSRWAQDELGAVELAQALAESRLRARELRSLQQRDELILAAADTGVIGVDERGSITFANPAAARLLAGDVAGQDLHEVLHVAAGGPLHERSACPVVQALADGVAQRVPQDRLVRRDGVHIDVQYVAAPMVADGQSTGAVVTLEDISARRAVDRLKDEFVSVVSHELRTPLTSIRGSLGLVTSGRFGELPAPAARLVDIAVNNTDRLVRLVNDILDLERIESGKVEVDLRPQPLLPLLHAAADALAGAALAAEVPLEVGGDDVEAAVDADLVVQALTNLVGNAMKFSNAGSPVTLSTERAGGEVLIRVRDRGRGIPADRLGRIFERFEQVDASDAREKGGTGLGLAITRSIAERLGGRVRVESEPGVGSTFTMVLPAVAAAPGSAATRVVLVEDDSDLTEVLTSGLRGAGLDVYTARTEDQAVELVQRLRPALLMLDVELAQGSGYGVAARLRRDPELALTPTVVATVHDLAEASRERLRLGETRFVRKGRGDEDVVQVLIDAAHAVAGSS
jgi:PAS domain S-box-containing protein